MSADGICELSESAAASCHVVIAEVLAAAQVVDMHKSILALMLYANRKVQIITLVLRVVHNQNVFALGAEKTADLQLVFGKGNGNPVFIRLFLNGLTNGTPKSELLFSLQQQ